MDGEVILVEGGGGGEGSSGRAAEEDDEAEAAAPVKAKGVSTRGVVNIGLLVRGNTSVGGHLFCY